MANSSEPAMDFLDGSDVDEDNVGDVDQDAENVLLGSDEEESAPQHFSKSPGAFGVKGRRMDRHSEEEEDVLNLVLQGDEEPLDFDAGPSSRVEAKYRLGPKVTDDGDHEVDYDNAASASDYVGVGDPADSHDDGYTERKFTEDDDCDDGDDETENRNTRSRFTSERSVQSLSVGNGGGGGGSSVGIPIQTVGNLNKIRPGTPEGRPKHWNHNHNGPRPLGPRHPGRNHRFPHPMRPPLQGDGPHMRPNMMNPQIVQFNEGLFTDFNQPMRHPHARPRHPPPHGRFEPPQSPHRHPGPPPHPNNMRPNFPPPNQQRPFFPPPENQIPPRVPGPGNMQQMQQQPPPQQPNFNLRGQRPPRFPPHNMNHRHPRPPPHMNNQQPHNMQHSERPPFPPRAQRPPFGHGFPPHDPSGMNARMPNAQGFPTPPHHNMPPGFMPPPMHPNPNNPGRYMGAPSGPPPDHNNPFYMQPPAGPNYHHVQETAPYQQDSQWGVSGVSDNVPSATNPGHSPWYNQQQQQPQQHNMSGPSYNSNVMYEQTPRQNPILMQQQNMGGQQQLQIQLASHQLEVEAPPRSQIPTSIYIKPNSQIHEALSKGQFRPPPREEEQRRYESSTSSSHSHSHSSSSRHYDDHYHERGDRERSSNSRRGSSPSSERRRDDDDYYDDRKSYHHERRSRRRYDDDRSRSRSPEKKMSRSERSSDNYHDHGKDKDVDNKSADKLLEEAKKMGLGEDYVKKLEEQRRLRERILKTKEQRRKQVNVKVGGSETSSEKDATAKTSQPKDAAQKSANSGIVKSLQKGNIEIEADSTVATGKAGKPKKILRIVRDKSGKIISKKVHVVVLAKPQQDGQQSTSTA